MKKRFIPIIILAGLWGITSCHQDDKLSQKTDIINSVTGSNFKEAITDGNGEKYTPAEGVNLKDDNIAKTRISYTESKVDLGEVEEGTKVQHSFEFKNTGNAPLFIQSAKGSCGCTVPNYSKEPIAPGQTGKIDVAFDSNGRVGSNTKTVSVTANTTPSTTILTFTVKVKPKAS